MFPNYAMTQQQRRRPGSMIDLKGAAPDAIGKADSMPQHGSTWREMLPEIVRGFQGQGLIGAGVGLAGALLDRKRRKLPLGVIQN